MATLSQLVETIAKWEGMDPATVGLIARSVRESGLITTGGRGPSAAKMTFADAANLLIAVNASVTAREAPEVVRKYRRLEAWSQGRTLGRFGEALEKLIEVLTTSHTLPKTYLSLALPALLSQRRIDDVEVTFRRPNAQASVRISVYHSHEEFEFQIHCHRLPELTARRANKVTGISFDFDSPEERLFLHPDGAVTLEDGTPFMLHPKDRRDTTIIGYSTVSAVAFLLEHGRPKGVG